MKKFCKNQYIRVWKTNPRNIRKNIFSTLSSTFRVNDHNYYISGPVPQALFWTVKTTEV
jgi:hypothetical protein